jgi:putative acetyltransferase
MTFQIRTILPQDNPALARVVRQSLKEFGADKPGTVYYDDATDELSQVFQAPGSIYYVALLEGQVIGGAGVYPTEGLPAGTAELVKMYLLPQARGKGYARILIDKCFAFAQQYGYEQLYLETMPELAHAVRIYEKLGFTSLSAPLGNSGHYYCTIWMQKAVAVHAGPGKSPAPASSQA